MFVDGYVNTTTFLNHINDNGALWDNTVFLDTVPTHIYFSVDMRTKVHMTIPTDHIPKTTALNWLRQLGLRR